LKIESDIHFKIFFLLKRHSF